MSKKQSRNEARDFKERERNKCKHCGRPESTGFSLWEDGNPFIQAFKLKKKLKFGELVSCPLCNSFFIKLFDPRVKDSDTVSLDFISEETFSEIEIWENKELTPTSHQLKVLKSIGATPPDAYTNGNEFIRVPCKCILKDGRILDFCILQFQKLPPEINVQEKPIYLDEVSEILPSEYTLSQKVRYATTQAEEIRNSYAPTVVRLPAGGKWIFNWTRNFFGSEKIKGKDIVEVLNENPYDAKSAESSETGEFLDQTETIIYAHWKDEFLDLEIKEMKVS